MAPAGGVVYTNLIVALFWLGSTVLSLMLWLRVWRGKRSGNEPFCIKCDYNLTAMESDLCPECGTEVSAATIVRGRLRRSGGKVWLASLLLAFVVLFGTFTLGGLVSRTSWLPYLPTGWVIRGAELGDSSYLTELTARYQRGLLSAAQLAEMYDAALRIQGGNGSSGIDVQWIDLLGKGYAAGELTPAQKVQFFDQLQKITLRLRSPVRQGDVVPLQHVLSYRAPQFTTYHYHMANLRATVGDTVIYSTKGYTGGTFSGVSGSNSTTVYRPAGTQLPPGRHEVTLRFDYRIFLSDPNGKDDPLPDYESVVERKLKLEVLPANAPDPILRRGDPALSDQFLNCITINRVGKRGAAGKDQRVVVQVGFASPTGSAQAGPAAQKSMPVSVAFDVFIRSGDQEWLLGSISCVKGSGTNYHVEENIPDFDAATVDVILRTNPDAARHTIDIFEVWDGELQFKNVPVQ